MKNEIIAKRREREKHYLNSDGTIECEIYPDRIHYLKDGVYEEIDNTLIEKGGVFQNRENDLQVKFEKENNKKIFTLDFHNKTFKMGLKNGKKVKGNKDKSKILYNDIMEGMDIDYEVLPNKVKEKIIIKSKDCIKESITFNVETDLTLELLEDKRISLYDGDKIVYYIDAPFMIDSDNRRCDDIYYELEKVENGYEIILKLDVKWLEESSFPVVIDPTITTKTSSIVDTYINSSSKDKNYGTNDILQVGVTNGAIYRALIKFDLPNIGTESTVVDAKLILNNVVNPTNGKLDIHQITSPWSETTATWNNMASKFNPIIEDYFWSGSVNITNLVKKWYAGYENYGLMIKDHKEDLDGFIEFVSSNYSEEYKPVISITYRNQNGIESYMTYQQQSITNGMIYANNYNGNVVVNRNLGNTVNGRMPANLSLYYNTNDVVLNRDYGLGLGFRFNYQQTIEKEIIERIDENEIMYKYTDEDGTAHYFGEERDENNNKTGKYFDEDGLSLELFLGDEYKIVDKNGNAMVFSKFNDIYRLTKISDTKENEINIVYSNGKLVKIIDGDNSEIIIQYNDNNVIINSPSKVTTLTLTNNQITKISDNLGPIDIVYNNKKIIDTITDITLKKLKFTYYEMIPYRVKKIQEVGNNDTLGKSLEFIYGFQTTTVKDEKGLVNTYTFNEIGNTVSRTTLDSSEEVALAYGKNYFYNTSSKNRNKLLFEEDMLKYIENILYNSSFELDEMLFESDDIDLSFSDEKYITGLRSLKLIGHGEANYTVSVDTNNYYTFSLYSISDKAFKVRLVSGEKVEELEIKPSEEFVRNELTIFNENSDNLTISIVSDEATIYIDDIQLEKGKVANSYNLFDNGNFRYGLSGWEYEQGVAIPLNGTFEPKNIGGRYDQIVTFENGSKAFKMICDPYFDNVLDRRIKMNGKKGDTYFISFWYKNLGVPNNPYLEYKANHVYTKFLPSDLEMGGSGMAFNVPLNPNSTEWQFYSTYMVADFDYRELDITMMTLESANEMYFTNFTLIKSSNSGFYDYDENGNLINYYDKDLNKTSFKYDKNNQLIQMTDPIGNDLKYEYDNDIKTRILSGISPTGITNEIKYDEFNNPIFTKISAKTETDLKNSKYYLRMKGTEDYLKIDPLTKKLTISDSKCSHEKFVINLTDNKITIKPVLYDKYYLNNYEDLTDISFEFEKQENGSFTLKNDNKYLTLKENKFVLNEQEDKDNQQIYFEKVDSELFILNEATYTEDGKFISSLTDTLLNKTLYNFNDKGLLLNTTDSKDNVTDYTYNEKDQLTKVKKGDMEVEYIYNDQNLLTKIKHGTKEYKFDYDEFLNTKAVYVNDNLLVENIYDENNGNLLKVDYNTFSKIEYKYDEFDRVKEIDRTYDKYYLYYDNFGNLRKIESSNPYYKGENITYDYDLSQKLIGFNQNGFKTNYEYDKNNNIIKKDQELLGNKNTYNYTYNDEFNLTEITNNDILITYSYDDLSRLTSKEVNGYKTEYNYLSNGLRTSNLVNKVIEDNSTLEYKYDSLGNITHIYQNDKLIKQYYYDQYNQLIKEENDTNKVTYEYDNYGNILNKKTYQNDELVKISIYEYNNTYWQDQLTKYKECEVIKDSEGNYIYNTIDEEDLFYDYVGNVNFLNEIGEPALRWTNGRQLDGYAKDGKLTLYQYNKDGIRRYKGNGTTINNEYYLEGNKIIYNNINGKYMYFIYENDNVVGFKYENEIYFYNKNLQNDIIGIRNNNETIVNYEYDSFGNILSITDNNNDIIIDEEHIANINPFRYRSYYYDIETNLYYLNSRYYNPKWGRFINADNVIGANKDILSSNLYAYCSNNPVNYRDPSGKKSLFNLVNSIREKVVGVVLTAKLAIKLKQIGFENSTFKSAKQLKITLESNNITTINEISHFLSQCAYETNFGMWLTELGNDDYFDKNGYGSKYRGAGYIQLTWDYNYRAFSNAMGDEEIYIQGANYVANNYAWQAAGWWWSNNNMGARISNGASVIDVTRYVRGGTGTWETRQKYYDNIYSILSR